MTASIQLEDSEGAVSMIEVPITIKWGSTISLRGLSDRTVGAYSLTREAPMAHCVFIRHLVTIERIKVRKSIPIMEAVSTIRSKYLMEKQAPINMKSQVMRLSEMQ